MPLYLVILIFIALIALVLYGGMVYAQRVIDYFVGRKHRQVEHILNRRCPPEDWLKAIRRATNEEKKTACLERLRALIEHFQGSTLIDSEETRELLIGNLEEVYACWKHAEWREIVEEETER